MFVIQTPGPGTYNTTEPSLYKDKSPHYSMTSRNVMPGDTTQKPGPGAHSPENVRTDFSTDFFFFSILLKHCNASILVVFGFYCLPRISS